MKLKQRLLLVPILIFLYTLTKPFWTDELEPWEHRKQKVGKLERRENKSGEHPYGGAFVNVPNVDNHAPPVPPKPAQPKEQPRPYPVNNAIPAPVDPGKIGAVGHHPIQDIQNQPIVRPDPPVKSQPEVQKPKPKSPQKLYPDEPPLLPKHNPVSISKFSFYILI